jgi:hypothetical protein
MPDFKIIPLETEFQLPEKPKKSLPCYTGYVIRERDLSCGLRVRCQCWQRN